MCKLFFHQLWEVFGHYFFKYSLCSLTSVLSFCDSQGVYVDRFAGALQTQEALFIFLHSAFCSSHWVILTDLYSSLPVLSSACSTFLFYPLTTFSFQLLYFFFLRFRFKILHIPGHLMRCPVVEQTFLSLI